MLSDGELESIQVKDGWWRWKYITINGAEHIGGRLWTTKAAATRDGRKWVEDQQRGPNGRP